MPASWSISTARSGSASRPHNTARVPSQRICHERHLLKRAGGGRSHLQQGRCGQGFYVADIMDRSITETDGCRYCQELPLPRWTWHLEPYRQPIPWFCWASGQVAQADVHERLNPETWRISGTLRQKTPCVSFIPFHSQRAFSCENSWNIYCYVLLLSHLMRFKFWPNI